MEKLKSLENIMMPVEKVPVDKLIPGYNSPKGKSHFIVVQTKKGPKITNMCSDDYGLISNRELLIPLLESLDSHKLEYDLQARNHKDQVFDVDIIFKKTALNLGTSKKPDLVSPKINWSNSYDLSKRYGLSAGIWRLVCANGMMAPDADTFQSLKRIHTVNFSEISLSETVGMIESFLRESELMMEPYELLKERPIKESELEEFMEDTIEFTGFPKRQKEVTLERIIQEKVITGELTGWQVYSGFNYQLNHNPEITMPINKRQKMDLELIDHITYS